MMMLTENKIYKMFLGVLCVLMLLIIAFYLWRWDIFYDSDLALHGLSAKDMWVRGSMPLTMWSVGYPGLLLQGPLVVLFFKLFGIAPRSLYLEPALFFLMMVMVFFWFVKLYFDRWVALLATFFIVLSSPLFFKSVLRMCCYSETYALGILALVIYTYLIKKIYAQKKEMDLSVYILTGMLGFILGFGLYNYGLMIYFIGALALHIFLILLYLFSGQGFSKYFLQKYRVVFFIFPMSFLVGFSPKLYSYFILKERGIANFNISIVLEEIGRRFHIFIEGHKLFLNLEGNAFYLYLVTFIYFGCMIGFLIMMFRHVVMFWNGKKKEHMGLHVCPLYFIFPVVFLAFIFSAKVMDIWSMRYASSLLFFYAVALAYVLVYTFKQFHSSVIKIAVCFCAGMILMNNAVHIYQNLKQPFQQQSLQDIISILQKENINFAYGDYWVGYATTFLTNENIIIEPIYSDYLPFYKKLYHRYPKSALILPKNNKHNLNENMKVKIYSEIYRIDAKHQIRDFDIYLLTMESS